VFSIASSPRERQRLRICYAVKGRYTTRLEARLNVGAEVWVKLPYGEFVIADTSDAVLVAGGTGITAFTAFIEALTPEHPRPVWLVYGARSPDLLLFRDMFLAQLARVPTFHALFFTETPAPASPRRWPLPAARGMSAGSHCARAGVRPGPPRRSQGVLSLGPPGHAQNAGIRPRHPRPAPRSHPHRRVGITSRGRRPVRSVDSSPGSHNIRSSTPVAHLFGPQRTPQVEDSASRLTSPGETGIPAS